MVHCSKHGKNALPRFLFWGVKPATIPKMEEFVRCYKMEKHLRKSQREDLNLHKPQYRLQLLCRRLCSVSTIAPRRQKECPLGIVMLPKPHDLPRGRKNTTISPIIYFYLQYLTPTTWLLLWSIQESNPFWRIAATSKIPGGRHVQQCIIDRKSVKYLINISVIEFSYRILDDVYKN